MYSKQKTGRLVMGNYYGYVKDREDVTKLYVDEDLKNMIELKEKGENPSIILTNKLDFLLTHLEK